DQLPAPRLTKSAAAPAKAAPDLTHSPCGSQSADAPGRSDDQLPPMPVPPQAAPVEALPQIPSILSAQQAPADTPGQPNTLSEAHRPHGAGAEQNQPEHAASATLPAPGQQAFCASAAEQPSLSAAPGKKAQPAAPGQAELSLAMPQSPLPASHSDAPQTGPAPARLSSAPAASVPVAQLGAALI